MKTGDILLVPFPFTDLIGRKVRPAVVITTTRDLYEDVVLSAISSVVPGKLTANEFVLAPSRTNKLRAVSVVKVDRIVTMKREHVLAVLGRLTPTELQKFKATFRNLV